MAGRHEGTEELPKTGAPREDRLIELFLMRHGIALDLGMKGIFRDEDRPLSDVGRRKMQEAAEGVRWLAPRFNLILTSPLLRCQETAEIVATTLGMPENVKTLDALAPGRGFSPQDGAMPRVIADLAGYSFERALLVGHLPDQAELTSWLLTGHRSLNVEFKRGTLCLIEVTSLPPRGPGRLRWVLSPGQLRQLGQRH